MGQQGQPLVRPWIIMTLFDLIPSYPEDVFSFTGEEVKQWGDDRFLVKKAEPLSPEFFDRFTFRISDPGLELDALANSFGWLIISSRFVEAIRSCTHEGEIQFLEFPLQKLVQTKHSYYLLNPLKLIECIDFKRSDAAWSENDMGEKYLSHFYHLVVKGKSIPKGLNLFRIEEYPEIIAVTEELQQTLVKHKIKGYVLNPIEVV
jgi:hypothetical protein